MKSELISIPTDTTPLDGLWHEPDAGPSVGAALLFHGNTMNFYTGALRFLPPLLTRMGYSCLAFNRRGHDVLAIRDSKVSYEGAAFQTFAEGVEDNRLAAGWVAARGFDAPVVIGHSNGGMLAVSHVLAHPRTPALVLLSAHRGESEAARNPTNKPVPMTGARGAEFEATARAMVASGRGRELMLFPGWWWVASAESYLDRITNMPSTLEQAPQVTCPVLYVRGDQEERHMYPAEDFAARTGGHTDVEIVPDCDHFYRRKEDVVGGIVTAWLSAKGPRVA
ncbi:MAG: alpha/beta hydrolase [Pseudomonadota bacterium]